MKLCKIENCGRRIVGLGYCDGHYRRLRLGKNVDVPLRSQNAKGEGTLTPNGYRVITRDRRKRPEHVWIMEEYLGRELMPDETVHHKNGVRDDNRLENLELWSSRQPKGQRVADKLAWAYEIIECYSK